ncbi:MAG: phosphoethanolamine--lipid A transferase [Pseudomonadota bacterium]|nr:phosphoethanolamine--lipid A transferase [Pseudomonadota bacterium]
MRNRLLQPRGPLSLMLGLALWFSLACNWPLWAALWRHVSARGASGAAVLVAAAVAVTALQFALLALLAWRRVARPAGALLVLAAATAAAFMLQFGVVIDGGMMTNVWQTDALEVKGILNARWLLTVLLLSLPPLWWLWRTPLAAPAPGRAWWRPALRNGLAMLGALAVAVLAVLPVYKDAAALMRNDKSLRYRITPSNAVYATVQSLRPPQSAKPLTPVGEDARTALPPGARPRLLALVVGETARADHFSINGYARDTTPQLRRDDVLSFADVTSCGTSTAVSLPCMFSLQGRQAHLSEKRRMENLLDVLQRAGWRVMWLENQAGCKGVCARIPRFDTKPAELPPELCASDGECQDLAMLHGLPQRVAQAMQAAQASQAPGVVVVLHQMGSHGPEYFRRSAPALKTFQPECRQADLGACEREHIVNAYDNSIHATSVFLARTLDWLQAEQARFDTAMLYVSDHGESLGEKGLYLHGMPWALAPRTQTHVPVLAWFSPAWLAAQPMPATCLKAQAAKAWTHDNYAPSVLGLLSVQTQVYEGGLDIFAPCRQAA